MERMLWWPCFRKNCGILVWLLSRLYIQGKVFDFSDYEECRSKTWWQATVHVLFYSRGLAKFMNEVN